jgi:pseudouridine-5'-phosphate glycosidase
VLELAPEISAALSAGKPVVALESTIIAQGLPWPDNLSLAHELEASVRAAGAAPATVGICEGRIVIGLDAHQLERIARAEGIEKVSSRDLATVVALRLDGATTVAATMLCAARASIRIFATGGIGGVHRDVGASLDISADLIELSRTRVAIVCSGAKSILDLPRTLEHLETHGVPVLGYGTTDFPAFHSRHSDLSVNQRVDSPQQVAAILATRDALDLPGGEVIANPIPSAAAIPKAEVDNWIEQALEAAATESVGGKALTPFLLKQLAEISDGRTVAANVALVKNNAMLAARIALARVNST